MIIDRGGTLIKAQCKTGRLRNGAVQFRACSTNGFTGESRGYKGQVDVFLVWCRELNTIYEVPVDACGKLRASLRVEHTRNGQKAFVRYANDYLVPPVGFEPTASIL